MHAGLVTTSRILPEVRKHNGDSLGGSLLSSSLFFLPPSFSPSLLPLPPAFCARSVISLGNRVSRIRGVPMDTRDRCLLESTARLHDADCLHFKFRDSFHCLGIHDYVRGIDTCSLGSWMRLCASVFAPRFRVGVCTCVCVVCVCVCVGRMGWVTRFSLRGKWVRWKEEIVRDTLGSRCLECCRVDC